MFNFVPGITVTNYNYELVKAVGCAARRRQAKAYRTSKQTQRTPRLRKELSAIVYALTVALVLTLSSASLSAQETPADNWGQFRGNHRNSGVSESKVPSALKVLWTYEAGDVIESSAAV